MRGRAIRSQHANPGKTSNIWHLVCVEPAKIEAGTDLETLNRRFKAFVGVSFTEQVIENGIARLNIGQPPYSRRRVRLINGMMTQRAIDRDRLAGDWQQAMEIGADGRQMVEEIRASVPSLPRSFVFANTIMALLLQALGWAGSAIRSIADTALQSDMPAPQLLRLCAIAFAGVALVTLPMCVKALWLFLKHGSVAGSIKQIGKAVLKALINADLIDTNPSIMSVKAEKDHRGFVRCSLVGGTSYEKSLFLDALQEVLGPIDNPRYIMVRKSPLWKFMRKDYHSVPQLIGRKKEYAEYLAKMWAKYVGATSLIYTRTVAGRRLLVKARGASLSTAFQKRSERVKSWK
jgi:hypothetical protein